MAVSGPIPPAGSTIELPATIALSRVLLPTAAWPSMQTTVSSSCSSRRFSRIASLSSCVNVEGACSPKKPLALSHHLMTDTASITNPPEFLSARRQISRSGSVQGVSNTEAEVGALTCINDTPKGSTARSPRSPACYGGDILDCRTATGGRPLRHFSQAISLGRAATICFSSDISPSSSAYRASSAARDRSERLGGGGMPHPTVPARVGAGEKIKGPGVMPRLP